MKVDFLTNPVIKTDWQPKWYWSGRIGFDSRRINMPHMIAEGGEENRIEETFEILQDLDSLNEFTLEDAFNIQNRLLKINNWKGIKPGFRDHSINIPDAPHFSEVPELTKRLFPVGVMDPEALLEWYKQIQTVHPLSDLNGRVFGIIVSVLSRKKKNEGAVSK